MAAMSGLTQTKHTKKGGLGQKINAQGDRI